MSFLSPTTEEPGATETAVSEQTTIGSSSAKIDNARHERCQLSELLTPRYEGNNISPKKLYPASSCNPLENVSHEEDLSSLAALSEAMALLDKADLKIEKSNIESGQSLIDHQNDRPYSTDQESVKKNLEAIQGGVSQVSTHPAADTLKAERCRLPNNRSSVSGVSVDPNLAQFNLEISHSACHTYSALDEIPKPGTVKALAAKLNTVQLQPKDTPTRAQVSSKHSSTEFQHDIITSKYGIVPIYNPDEAISPPKSQRSRCSKKSSSSAVRTKTPVNRTSVVLQKQSPPKTNTPNLPSRSPLKKTTPLRALDNNTVSNVTFSGISGKGPKTPIRAVDGDQVNHLCLSLDGPCDSDDEYTPHLQFLKGGLADADSNAPYKTSAKDPFLSKVPNPLASPEVRMLQQQLSQRPDGSKHLNVDVRSETAAIVIHKMSMELYQIKKELEDWKFKAETAEKKVAVLERLVHGGNHILGLENISSTYSPDQQLESSPRGW